MKQTLTEQISRIKNIMVIINEQAFNDEGEPMMTHQQYNDYSEPSEPEYGDDNYDEEGEFDYLDYLKKELEKEGILLETYGGEEYFIRCRNNSDFMVYFDGKNIQIREYNGDTEESKENIFNVSDALSYIVSNKNKFYIYEESAKDRNRDYEEDARNRK